jgi:drug/metabolite transporter (DMT)-like permease
MHTETLRGIVSMLGAVLFFSLMDAGLKALAGTYSPMQVAFLRGISGLPFVLLPAIRNWRVLIPQRWVLHIARGMLSVLTLSSFVYAVSVLSLADAYSIFLASPLIVTALSVPMLGETVGWRRWVAIGVGLIGALIILRPTGAGLATLGGLAALISACCYALGAILIRVATRTDTALATVVWTLLTMTLISGALAIRDWTPLASEHWGWVLWIGITGAIGQLLLTEAFRRCAASVVAPFEYTALLWGISLDWLLWQVLPQQRMFTGAAIVVGSGLYLIYRERAKAVPAG